MGAFTVYNDRLPDPTFGVSDAGAKVGSGDHAPGFASVTVTSRKVTQVSRTNSGRGVHREQGAHNWDISINYNPMTREEFDIVSTFLEARNARLYPFKVVLPQHSKPKSSAFEIFVTSNVVKTTSNFTAGSSIVLIDADDGSSAMSLATGLPSPGDYINFDDVTDINHTKTYKIVRVEHLQTDYNTSTGTPAAGTTKITVSPPLVRDVANNSVVRFIDPTFRVIQKADVLEYNLNTDNLYQFNLELEEIQP